MKTVSNISSIAGDRSKSREIAEASPQIGECRRRLELLYEVAQKASSVSEVSNLIQEILYMTQRIMRASASSLVIVNDEKGELYFQAGEKSAGNKLSQMTINLDSGIANRIVRNATPLVIDDVTKEEHYYKEIDKVTGFASRSTIAVPLIRAQKILGILAAVNRADGNPFNEQDLTVLTGLASTEPLILLVSMVTTATNNIEQHQILIDWYKSMFEALIAAADAKDLYASGHSSRVKKYTMLAASSLSFSLEELQAIEFGALLHDIGKLWVHDIVLRKAGPLTDEEWHIMRKHALKGAHMLTGIPHLEKVREIVLYHHERYDGKGYPEGLKDKDIPIGARLVAVADAYDTMTTAHSYRDKMNLDDAIKQLTKGSGTQFCPVAVKAFTTTLEKNEEESAKIKAARLAKEKAEKDSKEPAEAEAATRGINDAPGVDLYEGDVTLMITSLDGFGQVKQFKKCLETVDSLKIGLEGWSDTEGAIIVVSLRKPAALTSILSKMPMVEKVNKEQDKLVVKLRTPDARRAFKNGFSLI